MDELSPQKRAKRALILNAAIDVFAEKGFHGARVSDVAERAGVADGTIYLYFRNKDDILLSIFESSMDQLIEGIEAALNDVVDPSERIATFAKFHLAQVEHNRATAEVLQVELRLSNKFLKEYRPEKLWAYLGILESAIRDGQANGSFRANVEPFVATWAIFGALDELAMQWVLSRRARRVPIDIVAHQVASAFLHGIETPKPLEAQ